MTHKRVSLTSAGEHSREENSWSYTCSCGAQESARTKSETMREWRLHLEANGEARKSREPGPTTRTMSGVVWTRGSRHGRTEWTSEFQGVKLSVIENPWGKGDNRYAMNVGDRPYGTASKLTTGAKFAVGKAARGQ